MLRYMLDTNICIDVLKEHPVGLREAFNRHSDHLCLSSVVVAALLYGAEKSHYPDHNRATVEGFCARLDVLIFDDGAAAHYGQLRATLERAGQPIGSYDLMTAAHARSRGLTLVTNNRREFERVPGLLLEN